MITLGVDAHKQVHVAVALDDAGHELGRWRGPNSQRGWQTAHASGGVRCASDATTRRTCWGTALPSSHKRRQHPPTDSLHHPSASVLQEMKLVSPSICRIDQPPSCGVKL